VCTIDILDTKLEAKDVYLKDFRWAGYRGWWVFPNSHLNHIYIPGQITGEVLMLDKHHPTLVRHST
jgi:hypothetical protein